MTDTLLCCDYRSLEIGLMGDLALRLFGDDQIARAYDDQAVGIDMHSNNARNVFGKWLGWRVPDGMEYAGETVDVIPVEAFAAHPHGKLCRDLTKAVWFGLSYGKQAYGFSTLKGADGQMIGKDTAEKMLNALLGAVPAMRKWFKWVEAFVRKHHGIYSLGGRWCDLSPEMESGEEWRERRAFRRGYNYPLQATGSEVIGDAMVRIRRDTEFRDLGFRVCMQVHDDLLCRGPLENLKRAEELLKLHMTSATANGTPLLVKIQVSSGSGPTLAEAK